MILDRIAALDALDHYDIRVVRSKFVDSPQDAMTFAARRTARDARAVPIVLALVGPTGSVHKRSAHDAVPLRDRDAIQRAYLACSMMTKSFNERILAFEYVPLGTDISIVGRTAEGGQKYLGLKHAGHGLERLVPIEDVGAAELATNLLERHYRGAGEKQRHMVEHLVLRASALFERPEVLALDLTIRLHDNTYTALEASIDATHLRLEKRLDRYAYDRESYGYHPAGRV